MFNTETNPAADEHSSRETKRLTRFVWLAFAIGARFGASLTVIILWFGAHQAAAAPAPATDPGVALYDYARHASACIEFAKDFTD